MNNPTTSRSLWIDAPRDVVWKALTEPANISTWLLPPALGAELVKLDEQRIGSALGGMTIPLLEFEVIEHAQQLTWLGLPDRLYPISFSLHDQANGTQIVVSMQAATSQLNHPHADAWDHGLRNLQAALAGEALPFPDGFIAKLLGYRHEAVQFSLERSIWIAAAQPKVWQAITDPQAYSIWFSPNSAWELSSLEAGGKLFVRDPETGGELYTQIIELIDPIQRFVLRTDANTLGAAERTDYRLNAEANGTRLTIINTGYTLLDPSQRDTSMEQNSVGFGMMLENIQAYLEQRSLPYPWGF
ncbi:SRPBCC domain-containing protein [Herpetosiphon llansteffanensis]